MARHILPIEIVSLEWKKFSNIKNIEKNTFFREKHFNSDTLILEISENCKMKKCKKPLQTLPDTTLFHWHLTFKDLHSKNAQQSH